ncbi:hypothetical protein [Bradyrhizobium sp. B117]|uniref:hypothetical protein n=1 Tax=Bradyrhizobium sp. B117 TaxID=3140246 RepID=UPI003183B170
MRDQLQLTGPTCHGGLTRLEPWQVIFDIRRHAIGYAGQFLRVIPRVSTAYIVAEPAIANDVAAETARADEEAREAVADRLFEMGKLPIRQSKIGAAEEVVA